MWELANAIYNTIAGRKHSTLVMLDPAPHHLVLTVSMGTDKLQWAQMGFNGFEGAPERHSDARACQRHVYQYRWEKALYSRHAKPGPHYLVLVV